MGTPSFHLERFVEAQATVYTQALAELQAGQKRSHWMWFIFPQLRGLGASPTSQRYAISSLSEARAYLEHPLLGGRLRECTGIVNGIAHRTAGEIFGWPDELKFRSCITLFARAAGAESIFATALATRFNAAPDQATLQRLAQLEHA
jgi:uncharacterized protein (DUF1810 family)